MKLIPLTKGYFAKVDDDDFERLSEWKWRVIISRNGLHLPYAARSGFRQDGKYADIFMHREVLNADPEYEIDHRDRDSLNNQRLNLRLATTAQNAQNRKTRKHGNPYKGVTFHKRIGKFAAAICINKIKKHLGYFVNAKDAAMAYDREALVNFGEFALTNQQMGVL